MINLPAILSFSAAGLLLALALFHIRRGNSKAQKTFFILSCIVLAAVQASLGSMLLSATPSGSLLTFRFFSGFSAFAPAVILPFFFLFGRRDEKKIPAGPIYWIVALLILIGAALVASAPHLFVREIYFTEYVFWGFTFTGYGKLFGVYLLLMNIFGLFFLENTYRSASVVGKVTLKYPILGILTISVLTFVILSRILAVSLTDRYFLAIHSCGFIALAASFFFATLRYRLFDVQVYIGRDVITSVLTITISGLYILALALITFLARVLGLPFERFTLTVLGLFAMFLLTAVLISGKAKRRLRHFVESNFYANQYDYRKEWRRYAQLMGSSETVGEFLSSFIGLLCNTMFVERGIVWADVKGGKVACYGFGKEEPNTSFIRNVSKLVSKKSVVFFKKGPSIPDSVSGEGYSSEHGNATGWIRAVAAVENGGERLGLVLLGEKSMNIRYTEEDRECLATLSDQAALTLENLLIKERVLDSKQMESFNRFSSFVMHDLKNAIGMLSLAAENARENIGDTAFQRDAFITIERSVDKMKGLIHSLNALKAPTEISKKPEDITRLVKKAIEDLKPVADSRMVQLQLASVDRVTAEADASALERVVENLLMNALDATGKDGLVSVDISGAEGGWITISVKDTGSGFDPEFLKEHLFRPFRSTKKGGLGIGLVMCRTLVKAHGGDISVESEPERGSTVTVRIPSSP